MLVYGDHARREDPHRLLAELEHRLALAGAMGPGIQRHAALVAGFIVAGELLQGLADHAFERLGEDAASPEQEVAAQLCVEVAQAVRRSWDSGFAEPSELVATGIAALRALDLPATITVKLSEGYAFYGLYPELYLEAARDLPGGPGLQPIGIRSIGAGLSAMVSAACDASEPVTVRPIGHPYDRRLQLGAALRDRLAGRSSFAVVDEGPGMSGSSFAAVLGELHSLGAPSSRIHILPSHAGEPGPAAGSERRAAYLAANRRVAGFDEVILNGSEPRRLLASWVEDLTGPATAPLEDISGGGWRSHLFSDVAAWPPVWPQQEKRKLLLTSARGVFLLRYLGLGAVGEQKLAMAHALAGAGFINPPLGLRHGFLVERWLEGARPMSLDRQDGAAILPRLPAYLAFRAQMFTQPCGSGASISELFHMVQCNVGEACGPEAVGRLGHWTSRLDGLHDQVRPVAVDGRLQAWEWLQIGRAMLKSDAVDHHLAHDLVGCQDIAWDLAGASEELNLNEDQSQDLRSETARRLGREPSSDLLDFMRLAYLAFQMGRNSMAIHASPEQEAPRLREATERYRARLLELIHS